MQNAKCKVQNGGSGECRQHFAFSTLHFAL
jgi:hypothetical protein